LALKTNNQLYTCLTPLLTYCVNLHHNFIKNIGDELEDLIQILGTLNMEFIFVFTSAVTGITCETTFGALNFELVSQ
jgi:hypothetical protein